MKRQSAFSRIFWRIAISAVGVALIVIAVSNLLLFFFGETSSVSVSTRRVGGASSGRPAEQRYEWSVDYTFTDRNGTAQSGHTTRRGSDLSVQTDSTAYYFPFAPFINALESEVEPNLAQPLFVVLGIFLLYVMNHKTKVKKRARKTPETPHYPDTEQV